MLWMSRDIYLLVLVALPLISLNKGDNAAVPQTPSTSTSWPFTSATVSALKEPHFNCYDEDKDCFHNGEPGCSQPGLYNGTKSHTARGIECQDWAKQTPHKHKSSYTGPSNYCRNPTGDEGGPWCYTMDKKVRHEFCFLKCEKVSVTAAVATQRDPTTGGEDSDSHCCDWARHGECTINMFWMRPHCQLSCGTPGATAENAASMIEHVPAQCKGKACNPDLNSNCKEWAAMGECIRNSDWMLPNCQTSCNTCGMNPGILATYDRKNQKRPATRM